MADFMPFDLAQAYSQAEGVLRSRTLRDEAQKRTQLQAQELELEQRKAAEQEEMMMLLPLVKAGRPEAIQRVVGRIAEKNPQVAEFYAQNPGELVKTMEQGLGIKNDQKQMGALYKVDEGGRPVYRSAEEAAGKSPYQEPDKPQAAPKPGYGAPQKGVNPTTGKPDQYVIDDFGNPKWLGIEPVGEGPPTKDVTNLRKEFRGLESVKKFEEVLPLLVSARNAPDNGYGDLQLIYTAGKMLDPGSVVREGEVALAIAAGSPIQRALGITQFNAEQGGRLTPKNRQQLLSMLNERALAYRQAYDRDRNEYRRYAAELGVNPNNVIGTHPADAHGGQKKPKQSQPSQFEIGKLYEDAQGNKAIYMGRDKSGKDMWQEPR